MYCAFVDFRKAFDLVYRNGIWVKLISLGVSSKMVNMLKAIYESVKSCVRVKGRLSEYFDSYMGVKQGEPLSPLLFIIFINDMATYLHDDNIDLISLDEFQIYLLLFADDTVLFSRTPEGLQILLNKLNEYCRNWGISVNVDKTVSMTFKTGNRAETYNFYYNNEILTKVNKFTYLGVTLSSNGKFYQAQKSLSEQATKALFSLNSLFQKVNLDLTEKIKLFDSMIMPVLMYGGETWGFHTAPDVERIHLKFLKQILSVR
ncbi:MAG: reverse transcriptase family protein, partial [Candidatus Thiodiazotropha endolucinida]|nr:reverse transcriptase family protein [Candidatus Thiodiazotropha taylori]MCW4344563.1 reverse transcriptase family protein [Candidatus Thiodiazotropha endolucinida]